MTELAEKKIELDKFTAAVLEPGLIENHIKPGMNIESRDAWEIKKINRDLSEGRGSTGPAGAEGGVGWQ